MNPGNRIGLALAGLALFITTPLSAEDVAYDLNIKSQPLAAALKDFAEQSGLQVVYYSQLAEGEESPDVSGTMTADQAMSRLLASTDLTFDTMGNDTVVVEEAPSMAVSEVTSGSGNLQPMPSAMMMSRASTSGSKRRSQASGLEQADEGMPANEPIKRLEEVIVTGTNISGVRNRTTPVLQFGREAIDLSGAATVEEFLRTVPQNTSTITATASNSSNPFDTDDNFAASSIDLRGLGAGSTLVLLNGRRMAPYGFQGGFVDLSTLPLGVIERIDVQTDGASAVYGSDAVAGVVNFITRRDFEGLEAGVRYGTVTDGEREELQFNLTGGFEWNSGGAFFGGQYMDRSALLAADRDFVDSQIIVNPGATLFPEDETFGLVASVEQGVGGKLTLAADVLYGFSERLTNIAFFDRSDRVETDSITVNTTAEYAIDDNLQVAFFVDYSNNVADRSDSRDDFQSGAEFENETTVLEGQLNGKLFALPGGKASFAIGGLYRDELNVQGTATRSERDVSAVYGELLLPIVGAENEIPFVEALDVSIALRYEDYSDFGETLNPKFGVRWAFVDEFAVRGSYSESFRAPNLGSVNAQEQLIFFAAPAEFLTVAPPPPQNPNLPDGIAGFVGVANGSPLTEETAETFAVGFDYESSRIPGLSLSATYFDISYTDRIEDVLPLDIIQNPSFSSLLDLDPDPAFINSLLARADEPGLNFDYFFPIPLDSAQPEDFQVVFFGGFQNLAIREIAGFDLTGTYLFDTTVGTFNAGLNVSYMSDYEVALSANDPLVDEVDSPYRPLSLRFRGTIGWSHGGLAVQTAINFADDYTDNVGEPIDSFTTVDLSVVYEASSRFDDTVFGRTRIGLSAINLFDQDPPFLRTLDGFNFDAVNGNALGRFVSVRVTKSW